MNLTRENVPIFIDKVGDRNNNRMVRFYYFVVTVETKLPPIFLKKYTTIKPLFPESILEQLIPAVSWYVSTSHCVLRASLKGELFRRPDDIQQLFDFLYKNELSIDTEYLASPAFNVFFPDMERGQVFRLPLEDLLSLEQGLLDVSEPEFSHLETQAFAAWNKEVIGKIKKRYKQRPENNLRVRGLKR